jgi:1A family penicillin-binding protein
VFLILLGIFIIWVSTLKLPTLDSFGESGRLAESTKIYDRTGQVVLYDVNQNLKRNVVSFDQISQHVKDATIAIEDDKFYEHHGVRPLSFLRSAIADVTSMSFSQGGSTITQQVIKNTVLSGEKTVPRKIEEWILAIRLEQQMSKNDILDMYLNVIPYGGTMYGVEEASMEFFGKHAADLDIAESAYIAALPQSPTYYSPYGNHKDALEARKNLVLQKMLENGYITQDQYDQAKAEKVTFLPQQNQGIKAPHFVMYIEDYLVQKYGEDALQQGGYKVITTLDYDLQSKAEEAAKEYAASNEKNFNASNAAFIAIDPKTGQILAMVGSRDYFDTSIDGNFNVTTAHRQPGSTFKPFVYAESWLKGYTPETVLFDVPTQFSVNCAPDNMTDDNGCYSPVNYDDGFRGPMTMRNALAQSINVPAVKTLYLAGIQDTINLAQSMGVGSLGDPKQYGLTLALGGGEVSLLDMTSAYGVFANQGVREPAVGILEIDDRQGNVLEKFQPHESQVLPAEIANEMNDVLSDAVARSPEYGYNSAVNIPGHNVAVKTGTTNDYRDAWVIGYTPDIVIGAWAGNNDNSPMVKKISGFIVAPMWHVVMQYALDRLPDDQFTPPTIDYAGLKPVLRGQWQGGESYSIDTVSGKLATANTPPEDVQEMFTGGVHSILYWVNKDDPRGPIPTNPSADGQFTNWEYAVQAWAAANNITSGTTTPPTDFDDVHTEGAGPKISFDNPTNDKPYDPDSKILIRLNYDESANIQRVDYYLNDQFIGSSTNEPFSFSFVPSDYGDTKNTNDLSAVATDMLGNRGTVTMRFKVNKSNAVISPPVIRL